MIVYIIVLGIFFATGYEIARHQEKERGLVLSKKKFNEGFQSGISYVTGTAMFKKVPFPLSQWKEQPYASVEVHRYFKNGKPKKIVKKYLT